MNTLAPRLDVLPAAQRRLWDEFRDGLPFSFVLYGGTALALRTGSRESQDFDFFSNDPLDAHSLRGELPFLMHAELLQAAPSTATYLVDRSGPVKVSFFGGLSLGRVGEVSVCEDTRVHVASMLDLAAQKVRVVQVRAELVTLKALSYFDDGDLGLLPHRVKQALLDAAAAVQVPEAVARVSERLTEA